MTSKGMAAFTGYSFEPPSRLHPQACWGIERPHRGAQGGARAPEVGRDLEGGLRLIWAVVVDYLGLLATSVDVKEGVTWEMELEGKAMVGESFLESLVRGYYQSTVPPRSTVHQAKSLPGNLHLVSPVQHGGGGMQIRPHSVGLVRTGAEFEPLEGL